MTIKLDNLNENQRTAVLWEESPLLVLAGPGSGKTRVLTMRIANLITESPNKKFRVLGLTFTNKAATEMRDRVEELVPDCKDRYLLTTFHSYCAEILRQHGNHVGLKPNFTILNQPSDREAILADAIKKLKNQNHDEIEEADTKLLPVIDNLLSNCVNENEVIQRYQNKEMGRKISLLYTEYNQLLLKNNSLDFSSLLKFAHDLMITKQVVAKQIRTIYTHICVDEFQDTNLAQYKILLDIVGSNPKNLFVVADDDQIIYQWNGASPERLTALREDFNMDVVQLPANYRCPNNVIKIANKLIKHNLARAVDKEPLYAIKKKISENDVRINNFKTFDEELSWLIEDIKINHGSNTGSCVVLGRTKKLLENVVETFKSSGLDASLAIRKNEFTSAPFRWLHALLRLANGRGDREQLRRICKAFYELEGIDVDVKEVIASSASFSGDYLNTWFNILDQYNNIDVDTIKFLNTGRLMIVEKLDFLGFIDKSYKWFEYLNSKFSNKEESGFVDYNEEINSWKELKKQILGKYDSDSITLNIFLQELDLSEKNPPIPPNAIRCLTIHSSKGMEFEHVYLVGLVEDQLPSYQSIQKGKESKEMQEERRNCFVAITRAQSSLTLTYASRYFGWNKKPSRFLYEMEVIKKN